MIVLKGVFNLSKETVGKIVADIMAKPIDYSDSSIFEQGKERLIDYEQSFIDKLEQAKKNMPQDRDFYMEVHFRIPQVLQGLGVQFSMYERLTCPEPTFDQSVYLYHRGIDDVELLWAIPHLTGCVLISENLETLDPEQKQLAEYVMAFKNGTLFKNAKRINEDLADIKAETALNL